MLTPKYKLKDVVFFIRTLASYDTCNICEGKRYVVLKDESFPCPKCHGNGRLWTVGVWSPGDDPWFIVKVTSHEEEDEAYVKYLICEDEFDDYSDGIEIMEENLFTTLGEAQAECERRNKEKEEKENTNNG